MILPFYVLLFTFYFLLITVFWLLFFYANQPIYCLGDRFEPAGCR